MLARSRQPTPTIHYPIAEIRSPGMESLSAAKDSLLRAWPNGHHHPCGKDKRVRIQDLRPPAGNKCTCGGSGRRTESSERCPPTHQGQGPSAEADRRRKLAEPEGSATTPVAKMKGLGAVTLPAMVRD